MTIDTPDAKNQPEPLADYNTYTSHKALREAITREAPGRNEERLIKLGKKAASSEVQDWIRRAHQSPPQLMQYDAQGRRIDEVHFDNAWHKLMEMGLSAEVHSLGWTDPTAGSDVIRAGLFYLASQADQSVLCPIGMTHDSLPALQFDEGIAAEWGSLVTSTDYDPRSVPVSEKKGAIMGMALTEQSVGTDLRNLETVATKINASGHYQLNGLKWFFSAPQADAALVLARADGGISCFLMPRFKPDGSRNSVFIRRLKNKVGDKANASSEVDLVNAWARIIGGEGQGLEVIFRMIKHSRFDAGLASAAMMHHATSQALHYANQRQIFGNTLISMPLMQNVLADLAIEAEAATALTMRLARDLDEEKRGQSNGALTRIGTALNKYWNSKRAPYAIVEAMEVWGGNGYVDDHPMARLYTQAPLNSIWEGSGNVICLDVLRAIRKDPESAAALLDEIRLATRHASKLDALIAELEMGLGRVPEAVEARRFVEKLVIALQASLLIRHAPSYVSDAFCRSRLDSTYHGAFGSLPADTNMSDIIERAVPWS